MVSSFKLISFFISFSDCKKLSCLAVLKVYSPTHRELHYLNGPIAGKTHKANKLDGAKKAPHL